MAETRLPAIRKPGLRIDPDWYYVGMWYVKPGGTAKRKYDWLAMVWREDDDDVWRGVYRFRYSDEPEDRAVYEVSMPASSKEDEVIDQWRATANMIATQCGTEVDEVLCQGSGNDMIRLLETCSRPWLIVN